MRIIKLSAQRDMKILVKFLLSLPGMDSAKISAGLKVPPLLVLSTEYEQEANQMLDTLEKCGAVCELENTEAVHKHKHEHEHAQAAPTKKSSGSSKLFLALIMFVLLFVFVISYFFSYNKYEVNIGQIQLEAESFITNPTGWIGNTVNDPAGLLSRVIVQDSTVQKDRDEVMSAQMNRDLKKALVKNPYNDSVWKILYEKLEREGDSAGAKSARESHARAVKAQQVLLNLARGLGDDIRVEIKDNAVHYYINKELTDGEFYAEAVKLKKNLNSRFPGKDLILDNYASKNNTQSVIMKAE